MSRIRSLGVVAGLLLISTTAGAADRTLTHVAVIDAPVADVWRAFTVPEEMKQWMVAEAKVDLRVGGAMTTSYLAGSTLDDEHTIVNRILSYEPERMLSIQNVRAPANFENPHLFQGTWSVIYFEPISVEQTRMRSVGFGYGDGPEWDDIYAKFEQGNTYVFQMLQRHFAGEPGEVLVNPEGPVTTDPGGYEAVADARRQAYLASVAAANGALRLNDVKDARRWLRQAPTDLRGWEWKYLDAQSDQSDRALPTHDGAVQSVAASPDGTQIATASADNTVRIVDVETGSLIATLKGHTGVVYDVEYSHDGTLIATSSRDRTVRIWDAASHELVRTIEDADSHIMGLAFSPDDSHLAGTLLSYVKVWDVATGETLHTLEGHTLRPPVVAVDWSHDGSRIASGSWDNWVIIWDAATGEPIHKLGPGYGTDEYVQFRSVAFDSNDVVVVSAGSDGLVRIWNAATGEPVAHLAAHETEVNSIAFSPDGSMIASGGKDGLLKLWSAQSHELLATLRGHTGPVLALTFAPDGSRLISGDDSGTVRYWTAEPDAYDMSWVAQAAGPWGIDFSPDGNYLVTAGAERPNVWSVATRQVVSSLEGHTEQPVSAAFAPDNLRLVTGGNDGTVRVWNALSGEPLWASASHQRAVQDVEWSDDGKFIGACAAFTRIAVVDGATYDEVWRWEGGARWIAFSPDSTMLAAGCADGVARVWQCGSFELLHELTPPDKSGAVQAVVFSPDGRVLAGSTDSHTIILWDVASAKVQQVMEGLTDTAWDLEFLPDGSRLVSAAYDSTVRLWDPVTGNCTLTINSPEWVWTLAVSPDGSTIAWCPVDGTVVLSSIGDTPRDEISFGAVQDAADSEANLERTLELLHRTAGGEWIHESEEPDGSIFRVRNVIGLGPDGQSLVSKGWLGQGDGMYYHGASLIYREPGTNRVVFRNINENGAVAAGVIRAVDDQTLHWDWNATTLDGDVTTYDVRTIHDQAAPDTYRFVLSIPADDGVEELVNISYRRVNEAPERFRTIRSDHQE